LENFDAELQHNEIETTAVEVAPVENAETGNESEITPSPFSKHDKRSGFESARGRRQR
jgi:hypothetical protein